MATFTHKFNLYEDQIRALKELANKRHVTYSTVLREAVDQFLKKQGFGPLPRRPIVRR